MSALVRGLKVLAAANGLGAPTIAELVRAANLPKATVVRLVQTLAHEGYLEDRASSSSGGQGYRVTAKVRDLSRALTGRTPAAQLAQPLLDELARRVKWPSEFFLAEGDSVVIEVSNREAAPIKVALFEKRRFPVTGSATGIAYLSALALEAGEAVIVQVCGGDRMAAAACLAAVAEARVRGYATWDYPALAPGLRMASVPVVADRPVGGLSLIHFRELVPTDLLEGFLLPELREVAARIGADFVRHGL